MPTKKIKTPKKTGRKIVKTASCVKSRLKRAPTRLSKAKVRVRRVTRGLARKKRSRELKSSVTVVSEAPLEFPVEPITEVSSPTVQEAIAEIEAAVPVNIPILVAPHQASRFVIQLNIKEAPEEAASVRRRLHEAGWRAKVFVYINNLSVLSFAALGYWLAVNSVGFIFRIPKAARPLVSFTELPPLIEEPLSRFRRLRRLSVDAIYRANSRRKPKIVTKPWALPVPIAATVPVELPTVTTRPLGLWPQLATFAVTAVFLVLPLVGLKQYGVIRQVKAAALTSLEIGLNQFIEGAGSLLESNYEEATAQFNFAESSFQTAAGTMRAWPDILLSLAALTPVGSEYTSGTHLIAAAESFSRAGAEVGRILGEIYGPQVDRQAWVDLSARVDDVTKELSRAKLELDKVNLEDIPVEYRQRYGQALALLKNNLGGLVNYLDNLGRVVPWLAGLDEPKRYLVIFENNNELRATGGFMGSFGILTVRDGQLQKIEMPGGGTYDLQGSLTKFVNAPQPLRLINERLEFQDANWWPDWPVAAQQIQLMYQWAGGETVDGVIALDNHVVEQLLTITGPINLSAYDLTISNENFVVATTTQVEKNYDRTENKPKQFLADLAPLLLDRLTTASTTQADKIINLLSEELTGRHIQIYSREKDIQEGVKSLGWGGEFKSLAAHTDALAIVHTNIGGGKSDGVIKDKVTHKVEVADNGRLIATTSLTRTHAGVPGSWPYGVQNNDYIRFYVPNDSRLLSSDGFEGPPPELFAPANASWEPASEIYGSSDLPTIGHSGTRIYEEFDRQVFANWLLLKPGQAKTVTLRYELPWRLSDLVEAGPKSWLSYFNNEPSLYRYRFDWRKQAGTLPSDFELTLDFGEPVEVHGSNDNLASTPQGGTFSSRLTKDKMLTVLFTLK